MAAITKSIAVGAGHKGSLQRLVYGLILSFSEGYDQGVIFMFYIAAHSL